MGAEAGQPPLAVAAWCDPQARAYRLSWADVLIGLLIVGDDRIVFATPDRVVVNAPRVESAVQWRRGKGFGMIPTLDLVTQEGRFRLYLSRPSTTAPLFGTHAAGEIGGTLAGMGDALGSLTGVLSVAGGVAGIVGNAMSAGADFREMRQGREAARALRARLGQSA
jgi:hypothetical protein